MGITGDKSPKLGVIGSSAPNCSIREEGGHSELYTRFKGFDQDLPPGRTRQKCWESNSRSTERKVNLGIDGVSSPQMASN